MPFDRLSLSHGLSQSSVSCIAQDPQGFLWFGTQDGLNRYDGYQFYVFKHDLTDTQTISNNWINTILFDKTGVLWVGTQNGGLNRIDADLQFNLRVTRFRSLTGKTVPDNVMALYEDKNGMIWCGMRSGGLVTIDPQSLKISQIPQTKSFQKNGLEYDLLPDHRIQAIFEDKDGFLWLGSSNQGLMRYDPSKKKYKHYLHDAHSSNSLSHNEVKVINQDHTGIIWIGTLGGGVTLFDPKTERFYPFSSKYHSVNDTKLLFIWSIHRDPQNRMWIGYLSEGLDCIPDVSGKDVINYRNDKSNPRSISDNYVMSVYTDRGGTFWVGTGGGGLNKYNPYNIKFKHYHNQLHTSNSLNNNFVWTISEDHQGLIWIGTKEGLNRFDPGTESFEVYPQKNSKSSLNSAQIWSIMEDQDHHLWVGTGGNGLIRLGRDRGVLKEYQAMQDDHLQTRGSRVSLQKRPNDNFIWCLLEEDPGIIWTGTARGGINVLDVKNELWSYYRHDPSDSSSLGADYVRVMYKDLRGQIWIGTKGGGLNRWIPHRKSFERWVHETNDTGSISHNDVLCIAEDLKGQLWIGTTEGLNLYNQARNSFVRYTTAEGLPDANIYGVLPDASGFLWLSTNKGIIRLDISNSEKENGKIPAERIRLYDVSDGVQQLEFNSGAYLRSHDGNFYFGGINGFNCFKPGEIRNNPYIPPVVLSAFTHQNVHYRNPGKDFFREIRLSHKDRFIAFEFSALDFAAPEKNHYMYQLQGFDKDWIFAGNRRFVNYTNLDPGDYIFRVKGSNSDGLWNKEYLQIPVMISPPFWKTGWFVFLSILLLTGLVFSIYYYQVRSVEKRNMILKQTIAERTSELTDYAKKLEQANEALQQANRQITESNEALVVANRQITIANQMKSKFLANMSHELRTPLNAIIGFSDIILQKTLGGLTNEQEDAVKAVLESGKNLLRLINDILDLSKIEAGKMELNRSDVSLQEIVLSARNVVAPLLKKKRQTVQVLISDRVPELYVDETKIKQVLLNLLSNANKFSPEDGKIVIAADVVLHEDGSCDELDLRVIDNGCGIPADELELVFQEFRQSSISQSANYPKGTGLGLTLSRKIIEMHHGSLRAESDGISGSTFIVRLPLKEKIIREKLPVKFQTQKKTPSVLIIEDDANALKLLEFYLEGQGYMIIKAMTAEEGIRLARDFKPTVITLDVMLPDKSGWEVLETLKTNPETIHIPVILITAFEDRNLGYRLNASRYFVKPIDRQELLESISKLSRGDEELRPVHKDEFIKELKNISNL